MTHSWGSKFVAIVFSFIIHTENYNSLGTRIHGLDPPRKPQKLVPHEIYAIHSDSIVNSSFLFVTKDH